MKERFAPVAMLVGAGLLASCSGEQPTPPPQELVVAHQTEFGEGENPELVTNMKFTPLDIGTQVTGICVLYTREEITPEANSGFIKAKWNDRTGIVRISEQAPTGQFVDTFEGKTEVDLVATLPRC